MGRDWDPDGKPSSWMGVGESFTGNSPREFPVIGDPCSVKKVRFTCPIGGHELCSPLPKGGETAFCLECSEDFNYDACVVIKIQEFTPLGNFLREELFDPPITMSEARERVGFGLGR